MANARPRLVFRPLWIVIGTVATGLTILLGVLQIGGWVNAHAPWILWVAVVVLIITALFLVARVAALKEEKESIAGELEVARADSVRVTEKVTALTARIRELEASLQRPAPLGEVDRRLASLLYEYATDPETLDTVAHFFPYRISRAAVNKLEELADLPRTRAAHNEPLSHQLAALAATAADWITKLQVIVSIDGDHYTTKLDRHVSEGAYRQHTKLTDELGSVGFTLHDKFLEFQRYYASLEG